MKLKLNDTVKVLSGRDKGKTGEIRRILPQTAQVVVAGIGVVKKHTKPSAKSPQGGILEIEKPINAAKVAFVCPNCKHASRLGYQMNGETKERLCRHCGKAVK